ncbi:hypothetical protein [Halanaeroarchaeum sp. HSR-CO]|nr:hypothetical protein [Halanaeroarchaeum sp. HSR-CO]
MTDDEPSLREQANELAENLAENVEGPADRESGVGSADDEE